MSLRVEKSYEERIIDALANMPQKRGEHFIEHGQRQHAEIRRILAPLYEDKRRLSLLLEAAERYIGASIPTSSDRAALEQAINEARGE